MGRGTTHAREIAAPNAATYAPHQRRGSKALGAKAPFPPSLRVRTRTWPRNERDFWVRHRAHFSLPNPPLGLPLQVAAGKEGCGGELPRRRRAVSRDSAQARPIREAAVEAGGCRWGMRGSGDGQRSGAIIIFRLGLGSSGGPELF